MDELITLNQLKEYDAEKTNKLNVRFDNVYNYVDNGLNAVNSYVVNEISNVYNYVNDGFNDTNNGFNDANNKFDDTNNSLNNIQNDLNLLNSNILDVYNYVNNIHNELNETHNNFTTVNLSATNAQITDLNVANVVANNSVIDEITFNSGNGNNLFINGNYVLNNSIVSSLNDKRIVFWNNGKLESIDTPISDGLYLTGDTNGNFAWAAGGSSGSSAIVMNESDFNAMNNDSGRGYDANVFYLTQPNGNLYFQGFGYSPSLNPQLPYEVLVNLSNLNNAMTTHSLILKMQPPTENNFVNGSSVYKIFVNGSEVGVNDSKLKINFGDTLTTNAFELYVYDASFMYKDCSNLTDSFISNPSLTTNAPLGYDPMKYCINMCYTFFGCRNFNQPVTISNSVVNMVSAFATSGFNQLITIPNTVTNMANTFYFSNFNQPVTIPGSVTNMYGTFFECYNFNQPVTILNGVVNMASAFNGCINFNQSLTIPDSVTDINSLLSRCRNFSGSVIIGNGVTNCDNLFDDCSSNFNASVTIGSGITSTFELLSNCSKLNAPVTIGSNVTNTSYMLNGCSSFNQPIVIPDSVADASYMFSNCSNFDSPVYLGNGLTNMDSMFSSCPSLQGSDTPVHVSRDILVDDMSWLLNNYIGKSLLMGTCGIMFRQDRIVNDL